MSRTALIVPECPGWWVEFLAAVVKSLPRPGEIDQTTALGWANNQAALKKVLAGQLLSPPEKSAKFALLVDLGILTVPDDYDHATQLAKFLEQNRKKFYGVNNDITDQNFPNPTRVLKPGDMLWVRAFQQIVPGTTISEERLDFCRKQPGNQFTGAQGLSLVFDRMRGQLPKGKWYASFDEKERLWTDASGNHWVPDVSAGSSGDFHWGLGCFGDVWLEDCAFLGFCDLPAQAGPKSA